MEGENGLAIDAEEHEVGFPVAGVCAIGGLGGTRGDGGAVLDVLGGTAAPAATEAALAFGARQVVAPTVVLGPGDLGGDEAIDCFVADDDAPLFARETAGDLFGRPAARQTLEDQGLEVWVAQEFGSTPAPRPRLFSGIGRFVAKAASGVAFQLPRDARWRAIQSCRDLPDRLPSGAMLGNRVPVLQAEVLITLFHRNTPHRRCCTSFVNSANPGRQRTRLPP